MDILSLEVYPIIEVFQALQTNRKRRLRICYLSYSGISGLDASTPSLLKPPFKPRSAPLNPTAAALAVAFEFAPQSFGDA